MCIQPHCSLNTHNLSVSFSQLNRNEWKWKWKWIWSAVKVCTRAERCMYYQQTVRLRILDMDEYSYVGFSCIWHKTYYVIKTTARQSLSLAPLFSIFYLQFDDHCAIDFFFRNSHRVEKCAMYSTSINHSFAQCVSACARMSTHTTYALLHIQIPFVCVQSHWSPRWVTDY